MQFVKTHFEALLEVLLARLCNCNNMFILFIPFFNYLFPLPVKNIDVVVNL